MNLLPMTFAEGQKEWAQLGTPKNPVSPALSEYKRWGSASQGFKARLVKAADKLLSNLKNDEGNSSECICRI